MMIDEYAENYINSFSESLELHRLRNKNMEKEKFIENKDMLIEKTEADDIVKIVSAYGRGEIIQECDDNGIFHEIDRLDMSELVKYPKSFRIYKPSCDKYMNDSVINGMTSKETIDFIKDILKQKIKDIDRRLDQLPDDNAKIEYEDNYLGRRFSYEDILFAIQDLFRNSDSIKL